MRLIPMAMAILISVSIFSAFAVDVGQLPISDFADTEVSTNIAISLSAEAPRWLRFTLEMEASPSNNVEVAVGCDVDGDGCLSLDESALTVGYDCGEWFVRSMAYYCRGQHGHFVANWDKVAQMLAEKRIGTGYAPLLA